MAGGLVGSYILGLAAVAAVLAAFYTIVRMCTRLRLSSKRRLIAVIESAPLAQNTVLQIVRIGERYYALAGGLGRVTLLCELPAPEIAARIEPKPGPRST
jgi:flagellar biogenesis protein FliO